MGAIFVYRSYDYKSHKDKMWAIRTELIQLNVFTWLVNVQVSTFIILIQVDASGNRVAVCLESILEESSPTLASISLVQIEVCHFPFGK